ncbi:MAG TPA: dihydrolipoamide acetyltransferase family protein [Polyangiaceae bacterium]
MEFKLPDIGEGVHEGEVTKWLVKAGDSIAADQPMVEVMTDKATVTITSPKTGRVIEKRGGVGAVIKVHSVLVVLELEDRAAPPPARAPSVAPVAHAGENGTAARREEPAATAVGDLREDLPGMRPAAPRKAPEKAPEKRGYFAEKPLATPATRKLARDLGVDLRAVPPTGSFGRVVNEDVRRAAAHQGAPAVSHPRIAPAADYAEPIRERRDAAPAGGEERTPLKGLRRRIFENMARSKHTAAHFTFVEECDVSQLKQLRERLKPAALAQGVRLSFLPFFIKATIAALKRNPSLNASFDEATQEIVTKRYYNIGIATATESGLVVPVVKDADKRSLLDLAREIERLADAARRNRVSLDDLQSSTFTITSLGEKGGLFATPIIHFPEVAILGIHRIKQKPVVRDGQIAVGDVMLLSLSFDHRLIDGHVGAAFAYDLIASLEQPETLFLDMV